ncbi:Endonuclease/exonuclease/phosphatase [Quillaja saponaria]|uniref:Endonuclease/exonuclease/phosphatase n=1 Tax=Quillaja saponaria TaxID=32244 RepID=A0AAD7LJK9_QUISA|nr:Endonuclease/exonuclease/phosphatase [Quillaja saponaria]
MPTEKQSSSKVGPSLTDMNKVMNEIGIVDLGYNGNPHTWSNGREGKANTKISLDRALASSDWRLLFPGAVITHLPAICSDHNPIVLKTKGESNFIPRPFKFEAIWTRDNRSNLVVENAWRNSICGSPAFSLNYKLKKTKFALKDWNNNHFGRVQSRIQSLKHQIDSLQQKEPSYDNLIAEHNLKVQMDEWLLRE